MLPSAGLLVLCLGAGIVFRFLFKSRVGELLGWGGAAFLQVSNCSTGVGL